VRVAYLPRFGPSYWNLEFVSAGSKTPLKAGTYSNAIRFPGSGQQSGMDVSGDSRSCNNLLGTFTINAIETSPYNQITKLNAAFEQHCENKTPALRGSVDFAVHKTGVVGNANCDGIVNYLDIDYFESAVTNPADYINSAAWPLNNCDVSQLDINKDGKIDANDRAPFYTLLQ